MEVIWLEGAFLDSRRVREHIRQFNPLAAQKTVGRIEKAAEQLSRFPAVGRVGEVPGTRELVITGTPYFLVYRAAATGWKSSASFIASSNGRNRSDAVAPRPRVTFTYLARGRRAG